MREVGRSRCPSVPPKKVSNRSCVPQHTLLKVPEQTRPKKLSLARLNASGPARPQHEAEFESHEYFKGGGMCVIKHMDM